MNRYDILLGKEPFTSTSIERASLDYSRSFPKLFEAGMMSREGFLKLWNPRHEELHEHSRLQQRLKLNSDHVIVDKGDWERAKQRTDNE